MEKIEVLVTCPGCGYQISVAEKKYARYDYGCPKCKKYKFSEFNTQRTITHK